MPTTDHAPTQTEPIRVTWIPQSRNVESFVALIGRVLLGGYFVYSGIMHVINFDALTAMAANEGVPLAGLGVAASVILLLVGGLSIVLGFRPRLLAWWPILFLLPAAEGRRQSPDPW